MKLIQKIDSRGRMTTALTIAIVGKSKPQASLASRFSSGPVPVGGSDVRILVSGVAVVDWVVSVMR